MAAEAGGDEISTLDDGVVIARVVEETKTTNYSWDKKKREWLLTEYDKSIRDPAQRTAKNKSLKRNVWESLTTAFCIEFVDMGAYLLKEAKRKVQDEIGRMKNACKAWKELDSASHSGEGADATMI